MGRGGDPASARQMEGSGLDVTIQETQPPEALISTPLAPPTLTRPLTLGTPPQGALSGLHTSGSHGTLPPDHLNLTQDIPE